MGNTGSAWQTERVSSSGQVVEYAQPFARVPMGQSASSNRQTIQLASAEFAPAGLSVEQVRCQAAMTAILSQLTEMERGLAAEFYNESRCISDNMKCLQQELLMLRTAIRGNEASSSALEVYYQLAEAQNQRPILDATLQEIASMQSDLQELKMHDLPVPQDRGVLDRKQLQIQSRQQTLDASVSQGWAKLRVLLGENNHAPHLPVLECGTESPAFPPERGAAIQKALESRPELQTLRTMIHRNSPETVPLARVILQQYEGSLGTVQPVGIGLKIKQFLGPIFFFGPNQCPLDSELREVEVRTIQLAELLTKREAAIMAEVDAALLAWRKANEQWESANQQLASWQGQLHRLTEKKPVDDEITSFDLAQARLGILEAKADLIKASFAGRQAQVQLWTAQGLTASGCGLPGHDQPVMTQRAAPLMQFAPSPSVVNPVMPTPIMLPDSKPQMPKLPLAPAPKILPMSADFTPSGKPVVPFNRCRPLTKRSY